MADVRPLRGVLFDRHYSGPVGPLLAPPYDVVDRISRPGDFSIGLIENVSVGAAGDQHALAAARYRDWRMRGILRQDAKPAVYLHRHRFDHDGTETVRTGLIARVRLTDWSERVVLPHERTTAGPRVDRLERLRAVGANLSPLYLLFRDPSGDLQDLISRDPARDMPFEERDLRGGRHRLTPLTSPDLLQRLAEFFQDRTLFMADGHHRYEAALTYRNEQRLLHEITRDDESEFVLVLLAAVEDEGVMVRPIHRLIAGSNGPRPDVLIDHLRRWFTLRPACAPLDHVSDSRFMFRVVLPGDQVSWDVSTLPGNPHHALMPVGKRKAWRALPVAALQSALETAYESQLGDETGEIALTLEAEDANRRVQQGSARAAFLMPPPRVSQILEVAEEGDLMPAKSTWFEPKAPAGLVINEIHCQMS